jgi:hypothetical protein
MCRYHLIKNVEFSRFESKIPSHSNRSEPELGRKLISVHMYVRWLIGLMAVKIETIRPGAKNGWHLP